MPKINVYLPDSLAAAVRDAGIPVSAVCQRALADAVAAIEVGLGTEQPGIGQTEESLRLRSRMTPRAERVLALATAAAAAAHRPASSVELLEGLLDEANNLAVAVLRGLDVDPEDLRSELRATGSATRRASETPPSAASLDEVCERAAQAALLLGQNYIGCEHMLLGLLAGPQDDPATATLRTLGVELDTCRSAVLVALSSITYAQTSLSMSGLSAPVRSILEEIRQRLGRLEQSRG
ncbi:MAG TPA: Clp protease N-terminal domain-containing protein [Jatrophihabitans sp.]|jgi:ATP-dependent Clp protease ATP-binding subunit ClpC|nr:Clp protease N-terminal domain-containing protein [Jatrophihabitans sp.]